MSDAAPRLSAPATLLLGVCAFIALTALIGYTNAARGIGHWDRLQDLSVWGWMALSAGMFGFWGHLSILLSATRKTALGSNLFVGLGLMYLVLIGLGIKEPFSHDSTVSIIFQAFAVPILSTVVMGPLLLLLGWIGNAYGK